MPPQEAPRPTLVVCRHQPVILVISTKQIHSQKFIQFNIHNLTLHKIPASSFFQTQPVTRSGKVDGMVSNSVYPYVTITNKTPYDTYPTVYGVTKDLETYVTYGVLCSEDMVWGVIGSGDAWTASSRGACLVTNIYTTLTIADGGSITCKKYHSSGTGYAQFSIIMDGDWACCVVSSAETKCTY